MGKEKECHSAEDCGWCRNRTCLGLGTKKSVRKLKFKTMGDTAKSYFVKRTKDRGITDDDDFRRGHPQQDYLIMDDYAKGHSSKMEKGLPKKKIAPGNYGNASRKGPYAVSSNPYAFKNPIYSQPAWMNDSHKDQNKRWLPDELTGNADSWREFKPGPRIPTINRSRKESFQETEDCYRWQDGRGCRAVRRLFQKDLASLEAMAEMEAGSPENKKQRSRPRKPRRTRNEESEQDGELEGPVIDESVLSTKELLGLHQAEERLKRDCIDRLKRRPRNCPTAKYTCKLCDALIDSIPFAHKHIKEKRHKKNLKEKQEEELLTTLPPPVPSQINAVGSAIDKVVQEFGLHNENLDQRLEIKHVMENCSLRLYGSSCSRLGFRDSDVNIDVQFPAVMSQPDVLLLVQECLKNSDSFIDVDADFHARVPVVQRKEPLLPVYLGSWIEEFSLNKLGNFSLKDIEKDSVVWEYTDDTTGDTSTAKEDAPKETPVKKGQVPLTFNIKHQPSVPVGQLWVELLRFYALEFNLADLVISIRVKELISRESKDWPKKRIAIEDPYSVKRNVARTLNNQPVFEYILHCLRTTYKYFALPHRVTKPSLAKPPSPINHVSDPYKEARNCGPKLQETDTDKLGKAAVAQGPSACKAQPLTLKDTTEQLGSLPEEETGSVHIQIHQESSGCIEEFSLNKLGNFSLKDIEKDSVVWEYTDDTTGDTSTAKEDAPKETPVKKGQVPLTFNIKHQPSVPVGQLWVELLRFYALEFNLADLVISIRVKELISRESKDWPKKRIAIEDPYSVKRNVARTLNNQPVFEYILHCLRTTYKYFALPHRVTKPSLAKPPSPINHVSDPYKEARNCGPKLQETDTDKLGKAAVAQGPSACKAQPLTLKDTTEQLGSLPEEETGSVHIQIHQESSGCVQAEVSCEGREDATAQHQETGSDTEKVRGKGGHLSSTDDQGLSGSKHPELESYGSLCGLQADNTLELVGLRSPGAEECGSCASLADKADVNEENTEGSLNCFSPLVQGRASAVMHFDDEEDEDEDEEPRLSINHTEDEELLVSEHQGDNRHTGSGEEEVLSEEDDLAEPAKGEDLEECGEHVDGTLLIDLNRISLNEKSFPEENSPRDQSDFFYEFRKLTFTKGKSPTVVCSLCKREGHLKKDCPEDFKRIQLEPLPPLTPKFSNILDQVCIQCYKDFSPTLVEDQAREHIRQNLESFIKQDFPGTKLSLFGSSKNGFGFKQSDLDVWLRNILPITTAKVPIVKFFHLRSGLEVDISLYNTLALHNTRLLSAYSAIDPRVKYLCYTMKVFTKMCDIGDASRGSLSSYAYTLMVLYFLQQRSPPVIPVLQEIYKGEKKPEILVDGWNIYFFDQIDELVSILR
ncbi:hypothetical protein A6R68_19598 [Neotoma lepida]|uniref:CCHC-type domain-containing protein n=1 Tax=Neotoma lepida TaxID=56216 RepID=A0A1A6HHH3_NEOLE|nr:hypothetical protein A6R68_19598 [Neotoma lepida]